MRKIHVLPVVGLALLALFGCSAEGGSGSIQAAGNELTPQGLAKDKVFTACIDPEYPPLEYFADGSGGKIVGFDADAFRAVADRWEVSPEFEVTSFDGLMPGLQAGRCDVIFGTLYQSAARAEVADSISLMKTGPAILTTPDRADELRQKSDLCGLRAASQVASTNTEAIQEVSDQCVADGDKPIKISEYPKTAETVLAVLNGKADLLVETDVAVAYMETQNRGRLAMLGEIFEPDTTFGVFVAKNSPLREDLTLALEALRADDTFASIAKEYNLHPTVLDVS